MPTTSDWERQERARVIEILQNIPFIILLMEIDAFAVVLALLQGPLSDSERVAELGLRAIGNLAARDDKMALLQEAGACEGK